MKDWEKFTPNDSGTLNEYRTSLETLAHSQINLEFNHIGHDHASIVLTSFLNYGIYRANILTKNLDGYLYDNTMVLEALDQFLRRGGELRILLTGTLGNKNSKLFQILSKNSRVEIKKLSAAGFTSLKKAFENDDCQFTVVDDKMYRLETDISSFKAICNFNDPNLSHKLLDLFNQHFYSNEIYDVNYLTIYSDPDFKTISSIIIPDFTNINLELIEYFSKNPEHLQKLDWRKFEMLLDEIFKNQGYLTELGPGQNDGGIDLRLIQKDSIGQILTLVQAKKYKNEIPIRIEAVQALTAIVETEKANRGLFVTTSRYLPGVKKWADEQSTRIILANSDDVAAWCAEISNRRK